MSIPLPKRHRITLNLRVRDAANLKTHLSATHGQVPDLHRPGIQKVVEKLEIQLRKINAPTI